MGNRCLYNRIPLYPSQDESDTTHGMILTHGTVSRFWSTQRGLQPSELSGFFYRRKVFYRGGINTL